jgi:hypothetical protein
MSTQKASQHLQRTVNEGMNRLNRDNSELNLVAWAALLLIVVLSFGH